jgi:hypothetical protein
MNFYPNPDGPANRTGSNISAVNYDIIKMEGLSVEITRND